jgi:hypothetical protein
MRSCPGREDDPGLHASLCSCWRRRAAPSLPTLRGRRRRATNPWRSVSPSCQTGSSRWAARAALLGSECVHSWIACRRGGRGVYMWLTPAHGGTVPWLVLGECPLPTHPAPVLSCFRGLNRPPAPRPPGCSRLWSAACRAGWSSSRRCKSWCDSALAGRAAGQMGVCFAHSTCTLACACVHPWRQRKPGICLARSTLRTQGKPLFLQNVVHSLAPCSCISCKTGSLGWWGLHLGCVFAHLWICCAWRTGTARLPRWLSLTSVPHHLPRAHTPNPGMWARLRQGRITRSRSRMPTTSRWHR